MSTKNIIEGLQILQQYGNSDWAIHAEHDEIQFLADKAIPPEVIAKLDQLKWSLSSEGYWRYYV